MGWFASFSSLIPGPFLREPPLSAKNHLVSINSCLAGGDLLRITKAVSLSLATQDIPRALEALCEDGVKTKVFLVS